HGPGAAVLDGDAPSGAIHLPRERQAGDPLGQLPATHRPQVLGQLAVVAGVERHLRAGDDGEADGFPRASHAPNVMTEARRRNTCGIQVAVSWTAGQLGWASWRSRRVRR